jgi:hypothetical protein
MSEFRPVPRYERCDDTDEFLVGIVGTAQDGHEHMAEVYLLSRDDDPVGVVRIAVFDRDDNNDGDVAEVHLDGEQVAMLALILQDAARQWQERVVSHVWTRTGVR